MYSMISLAEIDEATLQKIPGDDAVCLEHSKQLGYSCVFDAGLECDVIHHYASLFPDGEKYASHLGYSVI